MQVTSNYHFLKPQASSLKPQASSLKPQASSLKPQQFGALSSDDWQIIYSGGAVEAYVRTPVHPQYPGFQTVIPGTVMLDVYNRVTVHHEGYDYPRPRGIWGVLRDLWELPGLLAGGTVQIFEGSGFITFPNQQVADANLARTSQELA